MKYIYAKYFNSAPVDKQIILFESFHGKEISDSPLAMAKALLSKPEAKDYKLYFSTNNIEKAKGTIEKLGLNIEPVHIHSNKYAELLASAGFLINNSSFPSYYVRKDNQIYLQTWHGTPWKTLGKSMRGELSSMHNAQHNFIQASHLLFPNDFTRDVIMRDYNLEDIYTGKVIIYGYPRNAIFCNKERAEEVKRNCGDSDYKTFAYMPTWRGKDNKSIETKGFVEEIHLMLSDIDNFLSDNQKMYVNLHPIIQSEVDLSKYNHIYAFPDNIEKYEFINSVDALITDYSSIFFDYSITGKPIILFTYDYENYTSERGMYFDVEELPFIQANSMEELKALLVGEKNYEIDYSNNKTYIDKFIKHDDINAADVLMDYLLFEGNEDKKNERFNSNEKLVIEDRSYKKEKKWNLLDVPSLPTPFDLDSVSRTIDENTIAIFHQAHFGPKTGSRMLELYDGKYPYVFTTESIPQTYAESFSPNRKIKDLVRGRNTKRQVGNVSVDTIDVNKLIRVEAFSIRTRGKNVDLKLKAPTEIGDIKRVYIKYRSDSDEIEHSLNIKTHLRGKNKIINATLDTSIMKAGCMYWDIYTEAEKNGAANTYPIMLRFVMRTKLKTLFYQCDQSGYIAYPHIAIYRNLAFTLREKTAYDCKMIRFKEMLAYVIARLFSKRLSKKKIWLVFEKFCSSAQDNGFYFFKYCMECLPKEKSNNIFFVIDKKTKDYENIKEFESNVVQFMSLRHMIYCIAASLYVGSDSRKHLYSWRAKPNLISSRMRNKPIHFLQHGVTALKKVDHLFGANGSSPMTSITTTSDYEQRIMIDYFGYAPSQAPVVGFTRWDVLEDKSTEGDNIILVMPTWRAWLEEKPEAEFIESEYFKNYTYLLKDASLLKTLEETDTRLIFFIHPKFKDYLTKFNIENERIELVQFGTKPLNEIIMKCSMLVTDYSSVCWDVYYLKKPVIFYQFDYEQYMKAHGSYMDMETELFDDRCTEISELIQLIRKNIYNGFKESEKSISRRQEFFRFIDSDNSKRTYEYLKKSGY